MRRYLCAVARATVLSSYFNLDIRLTHDSVVYPDKLLIPPRKLVDILLRSLLSIKRIVHGARWSFFSRFFSRLFNRDEGQPVRMHESKLYPRG